MIVRGLSIIFAICLMSTVLFADGLTDQSASPNFIPTTCDIIYFHRDRPIFIRVHIKVDGVSFEQPWVEYVQSLFTELDSNGDERWTLEEVDAILSSPGASHSGDVLRLARDAKLWAADRSPFDQTITPGELTAFLLGHQHGPLQPQETGSASINSEAIGVPLFPLLDVDEDGSLSTDELTMAVTSLHRRDLDDDGTFAVAELSAMSSPYRSQAASTATDRTRPFATLVPGMTSISVIKELERRYVRTPLVTFGTGRNSLSRDLTRDDLGMTAEVFRGYDFNADGTLDRDELRALIRCPPSTLELVVHVGERGEGEFVVTQIGSATGSDIAMRRSTDGLACLVIDDVQIEIAATATAPDVAMQYLQRQFSAADRDQNNYVDVREAGHSDAFRAAFDEFDLDGDGKLFDTELTAVVADRIRAARCRTRMDVRNRGRDLFEIFDVDRNRRLGRRELVEAVRRIELWDGNGDGAVSETEIPQLYQISFGPGQPQFRSVQIPGHHEGPGISSSSANSLAPTWFRKLDRNNDGELTRREFPGTLTEFQTFDQNSDGVMDAAEAEFVK